MFAETMQEPLAVRFAEVNLRFRGIDFQKPGYRFGWRVLGHVAEEMGVEVTGNDVDHWVMNLGAMRAVDDLVDENHQQDVTDDVDRLAAGQAIQGMTVAEAETFAAVLSSYDSRRRQAQLQGFYSFPAYAEQKRQATTVPALAGVIRNEAAMFAGLLELSTAGPEDPRRRRFNEWLNRFSVTGYLVDTCVDLEEDFMAGNSGVAPSLPARLGMARLALGEMSGMLRYTPVRSLGRLAAIGKEYLRS